MTSYAINQSTIKLLLGRQHQCSNQIIMIFIAESIPSLKKDEIENLSKSVGKSAWAKMIKGTQQKKETADKVKRDFEELRKLQ